MCVCGCSAGGVCWLLCLFEVCMEVTGCEDGCVGAVVDVCLGLWVGGCVSFGQVA